MKERIPAVAARWEAEGTQTEWFETDEETQGGLTTLEDELASLENEAEEGRRHMSPAVYPVFGRLLSAREEADLAVRARAGDDKARQLMMEANIRLVMSIARRYTCRSMAFEDLVQEGIIGLLEAINKFDVSRGNRFSTYATYWIRQAIVRAIEKQDRLIRLPIYGCDATRKLERAEKSLGERLGRPPTTEELARETGFAQRLIAALVLLGQDPLSLDAMVGADEDTAFGELMRDAEAVDPEDGALRALDRAELLDQVDALEPKEKLVIQKRFGLFDGRMYTLKEIADQLRMSREGVRHVQTRALRKLREALTGAGRERCLA